MKLKIKVLISVINFSLLTALPLQASNMRRFTATLLPIKEAGRLEDDSRDKGMLWIQNNPSREIFLQFDLSGLPPDLQEADFQAVHVKTGCRQSCLSTCRQSEYRQAAGFRQRLARER